MIPANKKINKISTLKSLPQRKSHMSEPLPRLEETVLTSWLEGTLSVTVGYAGTLPS